VSMAVHMMGVLGFALEHRAIKKLVHQLSIPQHLFDSDCQGLEWRKACCTFGIKSCGSKIVEVSVDMQVPLVTVTDLGRHRIYRPVTIETLPDEVLLNVFDFYLDDIHLEAWFTLTHVCRRWRYIVFASPLGLNLRLCCKASRPVREMLDTWPPLPIVIDEFNVNSETGADNIIAASQVPYWETISHEKCRCHSRS
jgi:hypothetical protein